MSLSFAVIYTAFVVLISPSFQIRKAMRGGAVFRAVGVMPSKGDGASTDTH